MNNISGKKELPKKKESPLLTYLLVVVVLMVVFALINPSQFVEFINVFSSVLSQLSGLIFVLIIIALIVYALRLLEKI